MSIKDFIIQMNKATRSLVSANRPLAIAALAVHQQMIQRIFANSLDSNETTITYKGGGARKGAYSERWAELREKKKRQIDRVDFTYTGAFKKDFEGRGNRPTKVTVNEYVVSLEVGVDDGYIDTWEKVYYRQQIFDFSEREEALLVEVAEKELRRLYDF